MRGWYGAEDGMTVRERKEGVEGGLERAYVHFIPSVLFLSISSSSSSSLPRLLVFLLLRLIMKSSEIDAQVE